MNRFALLALVAGCASGPRPVPSSATATQRFELTERALLESKNLTGTFEIDAKGENAAHMTGTIEFLEGNALHLVAEGNYKSDPVQLEVDSRDPTGILRTSTKGPSVSAHRDPPAVRLREAVAMGISRRGLLSNLALVSMDQNLEKTGGGFPDWVKMLELKDGAAESINGEACRRVEYVMEVDGQNLGQASVCISDATGLPLQRNQTVHLTTGDTTVVETFKWQVK